MKNGILNEKVRYHFVGIGGISMSGLAYLLKRSGYKVSGSDLYESEKTKFLRSEGISVTVPHSAETVSENTVVIKNSAISDSNPEIVKAELLSLKIYGRGEFLALIASLFDEVIAVAGSHGKSTVSAMLFAVMFENGVLPSLHLGADLKMINGNVFCGGDNLFITEACEYKRNFLVLAPDVAVITNVDFDHADYYKDMEDVKSAFLSFAKRAKRAVVCSEKDIALFSGIGVKVISCGYRKTSDYSANNISAKCGKFSFDVTERGVKLGRIEMNVCGEFNLLNALSAIAVAREYQTPFEKIKVALQNFSGLRRRFELLNREKVTVVSDYAHHPTEIERVIELAKGINGKVTVVFQPHTYSRTEKLMMEFSCVLSKADRIYVADTYAARESYSYLGSAELLAKSIAGAKFFHRQTDLFWELYDEVSEGDFVLFLGAGDIDALAASFAKGITEKEF